MKSSSKSSRPSSARSFPAKPSFSLLILTTLAFLSLLLREIEVTLAAIGGILSLAQAKKQGCPNPPAQKHAPETATSRWKATGSE